MLEFAKIRIFYHFVIIDALIPCHFNVLRVILSFSVRPRCGEFLFELG